MQYTLLGVIYDDRQEVSLSILLPYPFSKRERTYLPRKRTNYPLLLTLSFAWASLGENLSMRPQEQTVKLSQEKTLLSQLSQSIVLLKLDPYWQRKIFHEKGGEQEGSLVK